jgi:hypothetical protein
MNKSESISALAASLAAAQSEIENATKGSINPHFKSRYADLAEVINTVRPVFSKHGLSIIQIPSFADGLASVETVLLHKTGEWISGVCFAPVGKNDAQGVGSALTYLRRYSAAAFAFVAQEDDDGNAAAVTPKVPAPMASDADQSVIADLILATETDAAKFCGFFGIKSLTQLPAEQVAKAKSMLESKLEKTK